MSGNNAVIPAASANEPVISSNVSIGNLTVESGKTLTVNAGAVLTVTGSASISGTVNVAGRFVPPAGFIFAGGTINFLGNSVQTVPAGTYHNLILNNSNVVLGGDITISNSFSITDKVIDPGSSKIILQSGASVSRTTGYVIGTIQKVFDAGGSFVYPVGTTGGYSPVTVNVTNGTGEFSIRANQGFLPGVNQQQSISRYWTLIAAGITADITFRYQDADVPAGANESMFKFIRRNGSTNSFYTPSAFNAAANTFTLNGISTYSDWSLGGQLAPTAAQIMVGGRVLNAVGRPVSGAILMATDGNGRIKYVRTNPFGFYRFANLEAGGLYVFTVRDKRYQFIPLTMVVMEDSDELNFVETKDALQNR